MKRQMKKGSDVKKKILVLADNGIVHDSRILRETSALVKLGIDVKILGIEEETSKKMNQIPCHYEFIRIWSRKIFPKNYFGWCVKYLEFFIKYWFCILKEDPDIVHAHDLPCLLPAYLASKLRKFKIIYDSHELYTEQTPNNNLATRIWRAIERYLLPRVNAVIAANASRARIMLEEYGARDLPAVVMNIPNTTNISKLGLLQKYLVEMGIGQKRIVLYQGGIVFRRSLDILISSVLEWEHSSVLILMGYGSSEEIAYLKKIVRDMKLENRVFFHPAVLPSDLLAYTASADVGIVIYKNDCRNNYYCAPNKLFEYAAARVKVAACNFPEIRAIIDAFKIGTVFDPSNAHSISQSVNIALDMSVSEENFARLLSEYNWSYEKKKLYDLYQSILEQ
jgi:glycosyltransferase involved in cell wall biosynthesis